MKRKFIQNVPDACDLRGPTFRNRFGRNFWALDSKWMDHTLGLSPLGSLRGLRYSRGTARSIFPSLDDGKTWPARLENSKLGEPSRARAESSPTSEIRPELRAISEDSQSSARSIEPCSNLSSRAELCRGSARLSSMKARRLVVTHI
jgi:hypothetical protein